MHLDILHSERGSRYRSRAQRKCNSRQRRGTKFTRFIVNYVRETVKLRNLLAAKFHRRTFHVRESLCVRACFSLWASEHKRKHQFVQTYLLLTRQTHLPFRRLNFHCLHSHVRYFGRAKLTNRTSTSYFCETRRASKKKKDLVLQTLVILATSVFFSVHSNVEENGINARINIFIEKIWVFVR